MLKNIFISILILIVGFVLAYLASHFTTIIEFEISVVLAFIGISYTFLQYQLEKRHAEKRRLNDIKLAVYNNLTAQANAILEDCAKFFIDHHPEASKEAERNVSYVILTFPIKANRLGADIGNFNNLLSCNISDQYIRSIAKTMIKISENLRKYHTTAESANLYASFNKNIIDFTENLNNELLIKPRSIFRKCNFF